MWLLDYEFALYLHPLVVGVVLLVTDLQCELFYLPLFLLYVQILTEDHCTPSGQVLFLMFYDLEDWTGLLFGLGLGWAGSCGLRLDWGFCCKAGRVG
jgi:hypothetical protein